MVNINDYDLEGGRARERNEGWGGSNCNNTYFRRISDYGQVPIQGTETTRRQRNDVLL